MAKHNGRFCRRRFIEGAPKSQPSDLTAAKTLLEELFELREKYGITKHEKPHWEIARLALDEFLPRLERTKQILEKWADPEHPTGLDSWLPQVNRHVAAIEAL